MTNGDKIRTMSDEDLAKLIEPECEKCPRKNQKECSSEDCIKATIEWLKQEVQEDD